MKRDWKLSAPSFARPASRRWRRGTLRRRIVAPERLEHRNAPGAMLPMLPFMDLHAEDCVSCATQGSSEAEPVVVARSGGLSESDLPKAEWRFVFGEAEERFAPAVVAEEELTEPLAASAVQVPPSFAFAVVDSAFEDLGGSLPSVQLPTVQLPAFRDETGETEPAGGSTWMEPAPTTAAGGATAISYAQSTGGGAGGGAVRQAMAPSAEPQTPAANVADSTAAAVAESLAPFVAATQLTEADVQNLLERASRATSSNNAIIAIVDRSGQILGVRVEDDVVANIPSAAIRAFAIDGAIAKARTAAFFSNDQAILTSRTVRFISQSTITQREVEANPNSTDPTVKGPGFVAPIGVGGHFPPDVAFTPPVDLFAIEHTNRDSLLHPGPDRIRQTATVDNDGNPTAASGDDIFLGTRFGATYEMGQEVRAPESYGLVTDTLSNAQSRGIATLPGGVPLYKTDADGVQRLVGGIGVFFPGNDGYATFEQDFDPGINESTADRLNAPLVLEAEYIAALVAKNSTTIGGAAPIAGIGFPALPGEGRIDLVGITLESFGPHPFRLSSFLAHESGKYTQDADGSGVNVAVTKGGDPLLAGDDVPEGWLVEPTASAQLTADDVRDIIERGIDEANQVRAAIRLPLGSRTRMVLSVTDLDGNVLGLYRMPDATVFSIDVAVAKARNAAYYADANELQPADQIVTPGVAFTNRTFRYVAEPRYPSGIDGTDPPPFSTLNTPGVDPQTAENVGAPPLASAFDTALGFDAFNPGSNFHEPVSPDGLQNGVVFFPGSTPLYRNGVLVGGLGVSGDGVDQDDVVTFSAAGEFLPRLNANDSVTRADEVFFEGVRLPYQKFNRNPRA